MSETTIAADLMGRVFRDCNSRAEWLRFGVEIGWPKRSMQELDDLWALHQAAAGPLQAARAAEANAKTVMQLAKRTFKTAHAAYDAMAVAVNLIERSSP